MRGIIFTAFFFPILCFGQLTGKVVGVADGDTFTLLLEDNTQVKVRLHGIDCPEKSQDFGQVAKKYLSDLIFNKTVIVKEMDIDRYGRTIGMVLISNLNVNEKLLEVGLAWHYKKYDSNKNWAEIEKRAREHKRGLWVDVNPTPPWEYRNSKK